MADENGFIERVLENGLRVVMEPMPRVRSAAAGFLVRTGARDETPELAGVSHFLEHMCFKGTKKRSGRQITKDFDDMGSTYNAYTSKELTVFFGWVRVEDLDRQIELLADMMQSAIPPAEFQTEKKVILEEIAMSDDTFERKLYDLIHDKVYPGHSLSWPILGTAETVGQMTREQLYAYHRARYNPANMVLIVAGAIDPATVMRAVERICGGLASAGPRPARVAPRGLKPGVGKLVAERFQRQAVGLIYPGPSAVHEDREIGDVLAVVLGGQNSRFFWNIVQAGVAPQVSAMRLDYCDVGMTIAYGFCEPPNADQLLDAMKREIAEVVKHGVEDHEVQRVKNRVRTTLAAESEAPYYRLMQMFHDIDALDRPRTVAERLAAIDAVTPEAIDGYLQRWGMSEPSAVVSLGPRDWPPDGVRVL